MPVIKFRSLEAAREALWIDPADPKLLNTVQWVWSLAARFAPLRFPPGVHKYRSIEEAGKDREAKRFTISPHEPS
jgi:hypothetical protein